MAAENLKPVLVCEQCGADATFGYYLIKGIRNNEVDIICCLDCGDTKPISNAENYCFPIPQHKNRAVR